MTGPADMGALALSLFFEGKDAPEIAAVLTARLPHGSAPVAPDKARDLYQAEFRRRRAQRGSATPGHGAEKSGTAAGTRSTVPGGGREMERRVERVSTSAEYDINANASRTGGRRRR